MKLALILGTRPEIIRMSPLIRFLEKEGESRRIEFLIIHTGQHYDYEMDSIFFEELFLPDPEYNLKVGSGSHAKQFNKMSVMIEGILKKESPDATLVYGDTNTTLAGSLTSSKLGIPSIHLEAGCRSFDMNMPEEINRVCSDHISRILFPPDETAYSNLVKEGIEEERIFKCGNPLIDVCLENSEIAEEKSDILNKLELKGEYAVLTLHRQENVDNEERLRNILENISEIDIPVVFPIHPRTDKMIEKFGIKDMIKGIKVTKPLGYLDFLKLMKNCKYVMTDSGGIQVESNILDKPCIVLRDTTEWKEELGAMSFLVSDDKRSIEEALEKIEKGTLSSMDYSHSIGSSEKIIDACLKVYKESDLKMLKRKVD